jgi:hypothetical protein
MASSSPRRLALGPDHLSPRLLTDVERVGGTGVAGVGAVFLLMWATGRGSDPHGAGWPLVAARLLLPLGTLAAVAGHSLSRHWRFYWVLQLLLLGYLIVLWFNPFIALTLVERFL